MGFERIREQVAAARQRALQAAQAAHEERRRRRAENDLWVTGGVNWNGYGLKSLIKMVAERSSPAQLDALAGEWRRHGGAVSSASEDLRKALDKLLHYWAGTASDEAVRKVTTNATWIGELGDTAQRMSGPIEDASGALRSAQDTMPGMPKNNWLATAGGGAAAGFAVGGPIGAAFGAAIGGIVSVFGFGSKKKKMKRKAVQTMERYEGALLGIDQTTPQFGLPSDGTDPGAGPGARPDPGVHQPPGVAPPPGGGVLKPSPPPIDSGSVTSPSFAGGPEYRWQQLTGLGPGGGGWQTPGGAGPGLGANAVGGVPGMFGRGGAGSMGGGAYGRGGGRGAGGRGGGFPGGMGAGGRGDREYRGRGRFSKTGPFGAGAPAGRRNGEEDGEHRRRVPIEEDPFTTDLKAAPPVIGL